MCSASFCYCLLLLTPNYQWIQVEWSAAFSNHPKEAALWRERAQEVNFFPQWSGEGQKSVMSMSSDICNFCTCATGYQKFSSDIRWRLLPEPLVSLPRDQERRALGTRMSTVLRKNKNMAVEGGTVSHYYILVIRKFIDFMSLFRHSVWFSFPVKQFPFAELEYATYSSV